jgi:protein-S-isoprenylcysteine O-methyltransferase Ste14
MSHRWRIGTTTDAGLVTDGIFAQSRHPIYAAFALMATGTSCIYPNGGFLLLGAISLVLLHRQARQEEQFLHQLHGKAYADYCRQTRRWL